MQGRLWMAALTLVTGLNIPATRLAIADGPKNAPVPVVNKVSLMIQITGLGRDGCEVEIKPGHAACSFKPITETLKQSGRINLPAVEVTSTSADRDCLFAITVKEPGQPPKTIKRGLRLDAPSATTKAIPEQTFTCLLRSPSLAARDDTGKAIK